jgi:hypothetical protein
MAFLATPTIHWRSGTTLLTRPGHIKLDKDHHPRITHRAHLEPELVVARGLNPQDVAISLAVVPAEHELRKQHFDPDELEFHYLVHSLGEAGLGGTLVRADAIEQEPNRWVSNHMMESWDALEAGGHSPADIGLNGLARYLTQAQLLAAG